MASIFGAWGRDPAMGGRLKEDGDACPRVYDGSSPLKSYQWCAAVVVSINKNVSWQSTQHQEACNLYLIIFAN